MYATSHWDFGDGDGLDTVAGNHDHDPLLGTQEQGEELFTDTDRSASDYTAVLGSLGNTDCQIVFHTVLPSFPKSGFVVLFIGRPRERQNRTPSIQNFFQTLYNLLQPVADSGFRYAFL